MENHFYHMRWPPLNVTIFIMHMRNCLMELHQCEEREMQVSPSYIEVSWMEYFISVKSRAHPAISHCCHLLQKL